MKKMIFSVALMMAVAAGASAALIGDNDKLQKVRKQKVEAVNADASAVKMEYSPTQATPWFTAKRMSKVEAESQQASFTILCDDAMKAVWTETFDGAYTNNKGQLVVDNWTFDQGEGSVVTFTFEDKGFNSYDENDKYSLHIDGPYQAYKRTIGSATTAKAITVPANAQLTCWVFSAPTWNSYVVLDLSISDDDFATQTSLWKSSEITEGKGEWRKVTADLSAYAGKTIKLRFTYGPGTDDNFNTGGYMGDFYVDGISISGLQPIDGITVKAGDELKFVDITPGNVTAREWSFPGGTPETSTDAQPTVYYKKGGTYDVTLSVTTDDGTTVVSHEGFVEVEGVAPVAGIKYPCTFRDITLRQRMVAPFMPLHYEDASEGFPTESTWTFMHESEVTGDMIIPTVYKGFSVDYTHEKVGTYYVTHIAQNDEAYDFVDQPETSTFASLATNFMPDDGYQTNFVDGDITLPGANKLGITAWAEYFSKPSVPSVMDAVLVNFTKASADELTDQIANVTFYLYSCENGLPGEPLEMLDSWTMSELNYAMTTNDGTVTLELNKSYLINDDFFIVIEGIPEKNDNLECAIAMAPMRNEGNTAYMLNKGTWRPMTGYLQPAPGGQTSLAVFPYFTHSVISLCDVNDKGEVTPKEAVVLLPRDGGAFSQPIFANRGITSFGTPEASWLKVTNTPETDWEVKETVEKMEMECDAMPEGMDTRETTLTVGDGATTLTLRIVQGDYIPTAITSVKAAATPTNAPAYNLAGQRVGKAYKGIVIVNGKKTIR